MLYCVYGLIDNRTKAVVVMNVYQGMVIGWFMGVILLGLVGVHYGWWE